MNNPLVSKLPDADMQAVPAALLRAGRRAREIARQTGTAVVVMRDGKLIEEKVSEAYQVDKGQEAGTVA
jgi:adenine/guanine phosphoribosyltransferase-like PRPP-binding protein